MISIWNKILKIAVMNQITKRILKPFVYLGMPITYLSSVWLKFVMQKEEAAKIYDPIFMRVGVLPVIDQYYQPLINPKKHLSKSLDKDRELPGIDLNTGEQLNLLSQFNFQEELAAIPTEVTSDNTYYYNNGSYEAGDGEFLYSIIRHGKPRRIIEVGSGYSTLMAINAIRKNNSENPEESCTLTCIEPYEQPWLEKAGVDVRRSKVEELDIALFRELSAGDILLIDSSHIIRPQGDVLFEFLEVLPVLKSGVIIHVHDIFTPKDYPSEWINTHRLWNEQYLLEAFLSFNSDFKIIAALNYLTHHHFDDLALKFPIFAKQPGKEPGAFWMVKK